MKAFPWQKVVPQGKTSVNLWLDVHTSMGRVVKANQKIGQRRSFSVATDNPRQH